MGICPRWRVTVLADLRQGASDAGAATELAVPNDGMCGYLRMHFLGLQQVDPITKGPVGKAYRSQRIQCYHLCLGRCAWRVLCHADCDQLSARAENVGTETLCAARGLCVVCESGTTRVPPDSGVDSGWDGLTLTLFPSLASPT